MLDNRKLLAAVTVIALAGVLGLFVYSTTISPASIGIADIDDSHVGTIVRTNGTITSARLLSDGSLSMDITDFSQNASIKVYVPSEATAPLTGNITPGTVIAVCGEVLLYQEELEISVARAEDLEILAPPGSMDYPLGTILGSVEMFDGVAVSTTGEMLDIVPYYGDEGIIGTGFSLRSESCNVTYNMECFCFGADLGQIFEEWEDVRVVGTVSFYVNGGCWQIIVDTIEPVPSLLQ